MTCVTHSISVVYTLHCLKYTMELIFDKNRFYQMDLDLHATLKVQSMNCGCNDLVGVY